MKRKGESQKKGLFVPGGNGIALLPGTAFIVPGSVEAFMREQGFFYNSLSLASEATLKFLKCLKDRSIAVCSPSSEVITKTLICFAPDCAFGIRAS